MKTVYLWRHSLSFIPVARTFIKTMVYAVRLLGKSGESSHVLKQAWAREVLSILGFKLQVLGTPPSTEKCILVGNHISYLDVPAILSVYPNAIFMAKDDIKRWPIIGASAVAAGTLFVNRNSGSDRSLLRGQIKNRFKEAQSVSVVVFPSGTTCLNESKPWKKGIFEIAKQDQIPIQLFRIDYAPLRESAFIDDDALVTHMLQLPKIKNKSITLTWLDGFEKVNDPSFFAESLRQKVIARSLD